MRLLWDHLTVVLQMFTLSISLAALVASLIAAHHAAAILRRLERGESDGRTSPPSGQHFAAAPAPRMAPAAKALSTPPAAPPAPAAPRGAGPVGAGGGKTSTPQPAANRSTGASPPPPFNTYVGGAADDVNSNDSLPPPYGTGGRGIAAGNMDQPPVPVSPPPHDRSRPASAHPDQLSEVWATYLAHGDGRFDAAGLQAQLHAAGLDAAVARHDLASDKVFAVDMGGGRIYLLPIFDCVPAAVADWFCVRPGGAPRMARIQRLVRPAEMRRRADGGLELNVMGEVE